MQILSDLSKGEKLRSVTIRMMKRPFTANISAEILESVYASALIHLLEITRLEQF